MKNTRRMFFKGAATLGAGALLPSPVIAAEKVRDEVVAWLGVGHHRNKIAHGPARHVERRFHPGHASRVCLQRVE